MKKNNTNPVNYDVESEIKVAISKIKRKGKNTIGYEKGYSMAIENIFLLLKANKCEENRAVATIRKVIALNYFRDNLNETHIRKQIEHELENNDQKVKTSLVLELKNKEFSMIEQRIIFSDFTMEISKKSFAFIKPPAVVLAVESFECYTYLSIETNNKNSYEGELVTVNAANSFLGIYLMLNFRHTSSINSELIVTHHKSPILVNDYKIFINGEHVNKYRYNTDKGSEDKIIYSKDPNNIRTGLEEIGFDNLINLLKADEIGKEFLNIFSDIAVYMDKDDLNTKISGLWKIIETLLGGYRVSYLTETLSSILKNQADTVTRLEILKKERNDFTHNSINYKRKETQLESLLDIVDKVLKEYYLIWLNHDFKSIDEIQKSLRT